MGQEEPGCPIHTAAIVCLPRREELLARGASFDTLSQRSAACPGADLDRRSAEN